MQYALVNGIRTEPAKGLMGICDGCGSVVIAKCGSIKMHHWAHKSIKDCDSWWEPETEWHRDWKDKFPPEYREVIFRDENTNEIHRADIHIPQRVTFEFQNSPISIDELKSRENFYDKLIWVVNGLKFKGGFELTSSIPNPKMPLLDNFEVLGNSLRAQKIQFCHKSEITPNDSGNSVEILNLFSPQLEEVLLSLEGAETPYRMFYWKNKHNVWFASTSEVFIDVGKDVLYWLKKRIQLTAPFWYVQLVQKTDFIKRCFE